MVSVFVIGTAVGISTAWWMYQDPESAAPSASRKTHQASDGSTAKTAQSGRSIVLRGINPAELPYDGALPPAAEPGQQEAQRDATIQAQEDAPIAGISSDINMPESKSVRESEASTHPEPLAAPRTQEAAKAALEIKAFTPPASPKSSAKARSQVKQKPLDREEKSEFKRQSSSSTAAKDREIERIKQQADKELQRKLEIGRAVEEARMRKQQAARSNNRAQIAAMRESREARVRKILAKCERNSNFFRREQCKWQLCGGRWGKNGCPSYSKQASSIS